MNTFMRVLGLVLMIAGCVIHDMQVQILGAVMICMGLLHEIKEGK